MNDEKDELLKFKYNLLNDVAIGAESNQGFSEIAFLEYMEPIISDASSLDNIELQQYRNKSKGMRIDGFSYTPLDKTLWGLVVKFSNNNEEVTTITKTDVEKLGKQVAKFLENYDDEKFINSLALTDPGRQIASSISEIPHAIEKYKVLVITDELKSDRMLSKTPDLVSIRDKESEFEIWDLERIYKFAISGNESEPISVDFSDYCENKGIETLQTTSITESISSYVCVIPGQVLSNLFDKYGQRLLESNVRTFLSFRGGVNKGMRETLLKHPENFFAYNNGLTVTASEIKTVQGPDSLLITHLENMQIVNGGQTTSTIYFAPREKGTQDGIDFTSIDLSKVFVQMKLTVIKDEEESAKMKIKIAEFSNTQNAIQKADLVSNHPLHMKIEELSRTHSVPAGKNNIETKWFYERARGQYDTNKRKIKTTAALKKYETEHPKHQVFSKTDMAKFENTFRMRPWEVKQGAQENLKKLGIILVDEWKKDPANFEFAFYKDLISKAILFNGASSSISRADWYKFSVGFRADTVTYTIALLRHILQAQKKDFNLPKIYKAQELSDSLAQEIVALGREVRKNLLNDEFRQGNANPSSFGKKPLAWEQFKTIKYELQYIEGTDDVISTGQLQENKDENQSLNEVSSDLNITKKCLEMKPSEWEEIYKFLKRNNITSNNAELRLVEKLSMADESIRGKLRMPEDFEAAWKVKELASKYGYISIEGVS
jgi:hypothetical protein